ncbi:hypothetical protein 19_00030 [Pseudomonas phage Epa19]|nr:hypothetical protein 19_00030 [Pseudomonas phage Epa19]
MGYVPEEEANFSGESYEAPSGSVAVFSFGDLNSAEFLFPGTGYLPPSGSSASFLFLAGEDPGGEPQPDTGPLRANFMILLAM